MIDALLSGLVILIIGFIVLSGLLAMVDAAILSVSRAEIEEMVMQKSYGARTLGIVHHQITRAVVVIVILTNIVNVLGPILVGQTAIRLFGSDIIGLITGVLTAGTIL
jgi:Mg2+/Co2+ transporter CorB